MNPLYEIRLASAGDAEEIRAIRNDAIEHSTAMWTTDLISPAEGRAWLDEHMADRSAYVAVDGGEVAGFACWGPWRTRCGYRYTVENSVYVTTAHQGRGVGKHLLGTIVQGARDCGAHVMIANIEAGNAPSIALHERAGFEMVGTAREVGTKFGRWLDLAIMTRRLLQQPACCYPPLTLPCE
jgi:L-amino acid N-acyltransferase